MGHIEPTSEQFHAYLDAAAADDGPVVMINLLRYAERATDGSDRTGREAYGTYGEAVLPMVMARGGSVELMAITDTSLIGPADEHWDDLVLIRYPSRNAFIDMISSDEYRAAAVDRTAGLADSRLIPSRRVDV